MHGATIKILFIIVSVFMRNKGVGYEVIKPPKPEAHIHIKLEFTSIYCGGQEWAELFFYSLYTLSWRRRGILYTSAFIRSQFLPHR
jgi:hypothetical protein